MGIFLFTAAGCVRCTIAKKFLHERSLACEEVDAVGEGKARFAEFYRAHRPRIVRGREGIEFPVLVDGDRIRQGVAAVVAHLHTGCALEDFFRYAESPKGWVGGIEVSAGNPDVAEELAAVLGFLKRSGLKIELATDGRNASLLQRLLERGLGDRAVMDLKGGPGVYRALYGDGVDLGGIESSMALVTRFPEHRFETRVDPPPPEASAPAGPRCLSPDEVAAAAAWLKSATGSHRLPYLLRPGRLQRLPGDGPSPPPPLPGNALLRHRSAARRHQVLTEILSSAA
jgi:pyruvate formate lyase activating enzyme